MKRTLSAACVLALAATTFAQESEKTTVTTTETVVAGGADLISELWNFEDAVPLSCGRADLRLTARWWTASSPASRGDSSDDFVVQPSLVFGVVDNVELSFAVPVWVGDAGDMPGGENGNADTNVGLLWRFMEANGGWPAMALSAHGRFPTGHDSSGVDGTLALVMTNEYGSGLRSHVNVFGKTVNGHNDEGGRDGHGGWGWVWDGDDDLGGARNFQWGFVVGMDGPLCNDGSVRWVADYMNRSSYRYGASNINMLELGWEWAMAETSNLGMSFQIGLDDNEDTPNFGAGITYSMSLTK